MEYFIITGTSKGLGEALANQLLDKGHAVICIARHNNPELESAAHIKGSMLTYIEGDLTKISTLELIADQIFSAIDFDNMTAVSLINNAGIVHPIKPVEKCQAKEIEQIFGVNTIAPMALTARFIERLMDYPIEKRVINISSGAARKPYEGWSCYCSTKAAIDHFTRCVALEQERAANPVKIISLAPGVLDTTMQADIRATSREDFPSLDRFITLKKDHLLMSVEEAAQKIIHLLKAAEFAQGGILDLRD